MRRVAYRLARWSFHVSYWFHVLGDWLDELADDEAAATLSVFVTTEDA